MWTTILLLGGWMLFWGFLLLFVRWVTIERDFFAGQDPERWQPPVVREAAPGDDGQPTPLEQVSHLPSLGSPA